MEVSIIIINYNVKFFVEQCLYSVLAAVKDIQAEIIVFDNNSSDDSYNFLKDKFETVQFIWNTRNEGFSKANNIAAQNVSGKYILFLNPDTIIAKDSIEKCLAFYKNAQNAGALGIKMIDGAGYYLKESKRGFPTPVTSLFKFCGLSNIFPRSKYFSNYYLGHLSPDTNNAAPILSGAFMMLKTEIFNKTRGFDERFFMYGEDIDLSYRIEKAGYTNYYLADSTIIHFKGESTKKDNQRYVKLFYGAMHLYLKKHYGKVEAGFYSFFIHAAIKLKAFFNSIKNIRPFKYKTAKKKAAKPTATIIIGNQTDYDAVVQLSKSTGITVDIIGRVSPIRDKLNNCLGNIGQLESLIHECRIEKIIFCINELSVKEIIKLIEKIKPPLNYCFHASGSSSIVGSSSKYGISDCVTTS